MKRWVLLLLGAVGCGDVVEKAPRPALPLSGIDTGKSAFTANDQTPGFFRDLYRMLVAQTVLDHQTATDRLLVDLPQRISREDELPDMLETDVATKRALTGLALRAVQATQTTPRVARETGEMLLGLVLGLDPAREAWNRAHPNSPVDALEGGPALLAGGASAALERAASQVGTLCNVQNTTQSAVYSTGQPEIVWIEERCEPDRYVGGYCEPDRFVEGQCSSVWVPESCSGGYWRDQGYYEYRCYSSSDCRYVWRPRWVYVEGDCSGGGYDEQCEPDRYEQGLCYEGTFQPGACIPGHYEYRYPGGTWTYSYATAAEACGAVRPAQRAIAISSVQALKAELYDELAPEWQAAVDDLLEGHAAHSDDAVLDAVRQILEAASH